MRKVFVSSTSEDLQPYRQAALAVILGLGCHPEMMEHFGTEGSIGIVEACKKKVEECDLVLAILGWRRGWVPDLEVGGDGKRSITEIEIETAKALGKPIVALLARDDWPGKLWESDPGARKQIEILRGGIDRLAEFFGWEPVEVGAAEVLPQFRSKVRLELMRNGLSPGVEPAEPPTPQFPNNEIRVLSEALEDAHHREETIVSEGGDPTVVRNEILDLRRKIREGGNVKAGDLLAGRFKLIELLGDGGFATVWKAFDKVGRNLVAVKVLHPQAARDGTRLDRFFRGARKMAELHHQGIVRVVEERLADGGFHFFVMEYVEGGDLRAAVLEKRLPAECIVPLLLQVAEALQFAHDRGVVHRDIKPANILLGLDGRAKLTDFDLVRAMDTTGGTFGGGVLGTILYTAPESLNEPHEAGAAADVYSLSMTAAFCFQGKDLSLEALRNPKALFDHLPCSPGVRDCLRKGTAWEVSDRFQSVASLAEAIQKGFSAPIRARKLRQYRLAKPGKPKQAATLLSYLETEPGRFREADRSVAVIKAIEQALPIGANDLKTLGIVAWSLDYFPGRSDRTTDREAAARLRDQAFAPLRARRPPPPWPDRSNTDWAEIPGGSFIMGSPIHRGFGDENPAHEVAISSFRIAIHPVTEDEFARFAPRRGKSTDLPASGMDWYSAYAYATWMGGRLPTEAEWEYASRGGTAHDYSDRQGQQTTLDKVGWHSGNAIRKPEPVKLLEPNPWGLYDMIGNIWEWVADWYGPYGITSLADPWGPPSGVTRVMRGGSALADAARAHPAYRDGGIPVAKSEILGFRVALSAVPEQTLAEKNFA